MAKIRTNVNLGLDLSGGTHLVLQVVTDDAIRGETDQAIENHAAAVEQETTSSSARLTRTQINTFQAVGVDPNKDSDFRADLKRTLPEWDLISTAGEVPNTYTIRLKPNAGTGRTASNLWIRRSTRFAIESISLASEKSSFRNMAVRARTRFLFSSPV